MDNTQAITYTDLDAANLADGFYQHQLRERAAAAEREQAERALAEKLDDLFTAYEGEYITSEEYHQGCERLLAQAQAEWN